MRFLRDALITMVLLAIAAAIVTVLVVRRGGLAASDEPGRLERVVAARLVRLSIPADAEGQQNPFAADANAWRKAKDHYLDHCAVCHGDNGKGTTAMGANMYPPVPDLTGGEAQGRSDGAIFYIIQNGIRWTGMPAWKEEHSTDDTWMLVSFLRKLPTLTEADLKPAEPPPAAGEGAPKPHSHSNSKPHRH
jgi:mono/diheme cytochrome c family protein